MSVVQIMFATLTNPFSNYIHYSYAENMSFFKKKFRNEKLKSHKNKFLDSNRSKIRKTYIVQFELYVSK